MRVQRSVPIRLQVAQQIRSAIGDMRFAPGQILIERELCEATGASRASVREALRELESEGLVVSIPGRGTEVATISVEEADQIYEARAALEGLAGRLFTLSATATQRAALGQALTRIEKSADPGELLAAKNQFYEVLLEGAHNAVVQQLLTILHRRVTLLRFTSLSRPDRPAESVKEIRQIVTAINRGDSASAERACIAHIESARASAKLSLSTATPTGPPQDV